MSANTMGKNKDTNDHSIREANVERNSPLDFGNVLGSQFDGQSSKILLEMLNLASADDREDV